MVTHDLRHFYASAFIAGGARVKQVQLALGHASAVSTLRVYARLGPGEEDRTRPAPVTDDSGRTGCEEERGGRLVGARRKEAERSRRAAQAFLVSQKILSTWAM
nr:tyrosine-type recombinase/integrase [Streptomyces buecherae]